MERVLNGLTNLNLGERVVFGDLKNVENAIHDAKQAAKEPDSDKWIVVSSDSDRSGVFVPVVPKARRLAKLVTKIREATDNNALAAVIREFIEILKMNSSRTITKEAFVFIDALYKQLADPSVFFAPDRRCVKNFVGHRSNLMFIYLEHAPVTKNAILTQVKLNWG